METKRRRTASAFRLKGRPMVFERNAAFTRSLAEREPLSAKPAFSSALERPGAAML